MTMPPHFRLHRTARGRLVLSIGQVQHEGVVPIRNFPITAPHENLSLVDPEGKERLWIERLDALPLEIRDLIEEELKGREFVPIIRQIESVTTFSTPSTWRIETDRGSWELMLKSEEDIRRLANGALLITDDQGIQFMIPEAAKLDRRSRRLLERFL
jgi:hypothetical protein